MPILCSSPVQKIVSFLTNDIKAATTFTFKITELLDSQCSAKPANLTGQAVVTLNPRPTATISGNTNIIAGMTAKVRVDLTGTQPWNLVWSDHTTNNNVTTNPFFRTVTPINTTTYTVVEMKNKFCSADVLSGSAQVTVQPAGKLTVQLSAPLNAVVLSWNEGKACTLQSGTSIGPSGVIFWTSVTTGIQTNGTTRTYKVSPAGSVRFYRVLCP